MKKLFAATTILIAGAASVSAAEFSHLADPNVISRSHTQIVDAGTVVVDKPAGLVAPTWYLFVPASWATSMDQLALDDQDLSKALDEATRSWDGAYGPTFLNKAKAFAYNSQIAAIGDPRGLIAGTPGLNLAAMLASRAAAETVQIVADEATITVKAWMRTLDEAALYDLTLDATGCSIDACGSVDPYRIVRMAKDERDDRIRETEASLASKLQTKYEAVIAKLNIEIETLKSANDAQIGAFEKQLADSNRDTDVQIGAARADAFRNMIVTVVIGLLSALITGIGVYYTARHHHHLVEEAKRKDQRERRVVTFPLANGSEQDVRATIESPSEADQQMAETEKIELPLGEALLTKAAE